MISRDYCRPRIEPADEREGDTDSEHRHHDERQQQTGREKARRRLGVDIDPDCAARMGSNEFGVCHLTVVNRES